MEADGGGESKLRSLLQEELKLFPNHGTAFSLQRWLDEYNKDVDAIVPRLRWTLNALKALDAHNMDTSTIASVNRHVRHMNPAAIYFPGGLSGYDKDGNVVFVQPLGRLQPNRAMHTGSVSTLYRMLILEAFGTHQLICAEEEKCGERRYQIAVVDLSDASRNLINMAGLKIISNISATLQLMFPGVSRKVYVINAHTGLTHAFNLLQSVFTKSTSASIAFLNHDWRERLKTEIGESNILPYWGGTAECGKPTGDIRMGGRPPDEVRKMMCPREIPQEELTTIKVSPRRCAVVSVNVDKKGVTLKWYFKCSGGDIDFFVRFNNREVVPRMRLTTQFVPESGGMICDEAGAYEFCFDNNHVLVWNKTISYSIQVLRGQ